MTNPRQEMLKMWKSSWESCIKNVGMMQDQSEKMLDLCVTQGETLQDEAKNLLKEGMKNAKEAQKTYLDAVEDNFKKFEEIVTDQA